MGRAPPADGKRPEIVAAAVRSALRESVFRFELVMRVNVTAHDLVEREALIDMALAAQLGLLASEDCDGRQGDPSHLRRLALSRDLLLRQVAAFGAAEDARAIVEARYLDGHPALFPEAAVAWGSQLNNTVALATLADRLAELDGADAAEPPDAEARSVRAAELVADLVEPAKAVALEKLGEGERALGIATDWLRTRLLAAERGLVPTRSLRARALVLHDTNTMMYMERCRSILLSSATGGDRAEKQPIRHRARLG